MEACASFDISGTSVGSISLSTTKELARTRNVLGLSVFDLVVIGTLEILVINKSSCE